jgi:[glutamine synthetase] adenylyltransferase / [glutamine synthetase]-adenylyl-L-tyrosine phosphorylase
MNEAIAPMLPVDPLVAGIRRARTASRFVVQCARHLAPDEAAQDQALHALASEPWTPARLERLLAAQTPPPAAVEALAGALRRLRRDVLLSVVVRDAAGVASLDEVTATMTWLAELAVQRLVSAHAHELAGVHGVPVSPDGTPQDLLVVAMGKGGGGELNVSSDLDLVFVYDEDGETGAHGEFATRRGR